MRTCLTELKEQADSDGNFIGKTFEQLRELYAEKYPEYFEEDDLEFEAPLQGHGLTEADEKVEKVGSLKTISFWEKPNNCLKLGRREKLPATD